MLSVLIIFMDSGLDLSESIAFMVKSDLLSASTDARGEIILRTDLAPRVFLETGIHEAMHALNWAIPEAIVEERARELSRWLWRLGYRRVEDE